MELKTALNKIVEYSKIPTSETIEQRFKRLKGIAEKALWYDKEKSKLNSVHTPQEVVEKLKVEREEILKDERMRYETANVFINAPLALIQYGMTSKLHLIEKTLGIPLTQVPIKIK